MIYFVLAVCLIVSAIAIGISTYALFRIYGTEISQEEINISFNNVLENHKQVWEGVNLGLVNHREKIEELYNILHIDNGTTLQKFSNYTDKEQ